MVEYAKEVFDVERGVYDRTQEPHRYKIDVDVRKPSAPPEKRQWIYWGSAKDLEQAEKKVEESKSALFQNIGRDVQVRFVEAKTGVVLKKLEKVI